MGKRKECEQIFGDGKRIRTNDENVTFLVKDLIRLQLLTAPARAPLIPYLFKKVFCSHIFLLKNILLTYYLFKNILLTYYLHRSGEQSFGVYVGKIVSEAACFV